MSLEAGVLLTPLDVIIHDLEITHSLGVEEGELLESTIKVDFRYY